MLQSNRSSNRSSSSSNNNNNNKQQTTNNKQQTTNNKQQTTNNKQQTTNNKQQTTNNKQQTTNNKQQTTNNNNNKNKNKQTNKQTNKQQTTNNNQQPTTNNQQPTTNNQHQPTKHWTHLQNNSLKWQSYPCQSIPRLWSSSICQIHLTKAVKLAHLRRSTNRYPVPSPSKPWLKKLSLVSCSNLRKVFKKVILDTPSWSVSKVLPIQILPKAEVEKDPDLPSSGWALSLALQTFEKTPFPTKILPIQRSSKTTTKSSSGQSIPVPCSIHPHKSSGNCNYKVLRD